MKKPQRLYALIYTLTTLCILSGCASLAETGYDLNHEIGVTSREEGSGTRGAFVDLFGIGQADASGEKIDLTTLTAIVTNSTAVMMTTVESDPYAIGYLSLGSLNDTVKALRIDGAAPSAQSILDGSYRVSRPFIIAIRSNPDQAAQDFMRYILSAEGQQIISEAGYIPVSADAPGYEGGSSGKVVIGGSTSVSPVMEKLKEAYLLLNPEAIIEIQTSDSSTGLLSVADGSCDIGMSSRSLKSSEIQKGLIPTVIAMDGIVVIVNHDCPVDALSTAQVMKIFTGETVRWSDVIAQ